MDYRETNNSMSMILSYEDERILDEAVYKAKYDPAPNYGENSRKQDNYNIS